MRLYRLENPVQRYSWGSVEGLKDCLGVPNPGNEPLAEIWMGAHPRAPSLIRAGDRLLRLDDFIQEAPEACLGARVATRFGDSLPFLLKALSAAGPLSIQAHPAKRKAESGYEHENLASIPLDAPERNYRDRNQKAEMVVALTRFEGLFGFRPIAEIIANVRLLMPAGSERLIGRLEKNPGRVELSVLFYSVIASDQATKDGILARTDPIIEGLLKGGGLDEVETAAFRLTRRLREAFPGDIGALAPLVLNHVILEPGESLYVAPGELHAYMLGESLELMANSDNVIRGALTKKHVDVPELVSVLTFDSDKAVPFMAKEMLAHEEFYPLLSPDFRLSRITLDGSDKVVKAPTGPELLLCARGRMSLEGDGGRLEVESGGAAFACADCGGYSISGKAVVYRAFVPDGEAVS